MSRKMNDQDLPRKVGDRKGNQSRSAAEGRRNRKVNNQDLPQKEAEWERTSKKINVCRKAEC